MWEDTDAPAESEREAEELLFGEVMREVLHNAPGARFSARLRHQLESLSPARRRRVVSRESAEGAPLLAAARRGLGDAVEYLVHVCGAPLEQRGPFAAEPRRAPHRVTALWAAAVAGHARVVRALLDAGADIDAPSDSGSTPARSACFMTHAAIVRMLAERGADLARPNHAGGTCLINAVQSPALVRYLARTGRAPLDARDARGRTALVHAAREHRADTVRVLLAAGADPTLADGEGDDALRAAAAAGADEAVRALLEAEGAPWAAARVADALELLGATRLDELGGAGATLAWWRRATALREAGGAPKRPARAPEAALRGAREWRGGGELAALEAARDADALRDQALLVAQRVLGPYHKDTLFRFMYRGAAYADAGVYERAVALWASALRRRVERHSLLARDAAAAALALTRLAHDARRQREPAAPAWAAAALRALVAGADDARRLAALRPRCIVQAAAKDDAVRCAVRLLALALDDPAAPGAAPPPDVAEAARVLVRSDIRTEAGDTPLHLAAGAGNGAAAVALLLAAGAPVDAVNLAGETALLAACEAGDEAAAAALAARGAHADRPAADGRTALARWPAPRCPPPLSCLASRAAAPLPPAAPPALPACLAPLLALHRPPRAVTPEFDFDSQQSSLGDDVDSLL